MVKKANLLEQLFNILLTSLLVMFSWNVDIYWTRPVDDSIVANLLRNILHGRLSPVTCIMLSHHSVTVITPVDKIILCILLLNVDYSNIFQDSFVIKNVIENNCKIISIKVYSLLLYIRIKNKIF